MLAGILFSKGWWREGLGVLFYYLVFLTLERPHKIAWRTKYAFDKPEDGYWNDDEQNNALPLTSADHQE